MPNTDFVFDVKERSVGGVKSTRGTERFETRTATVTNEA